MQQNFQSVQKNICADPPVSERLRSFSAPLANAKIKFLMTSACIKVGRTRNIFASIDISLDGRSLFLSSQYGHRMSVDRPFVNKNSS